MTISYERSPTGMFYATSEVEPTFFVAARSVEALNDSVRHALEDLYRDRYHADVAAVPTEGGDESHAPWTIVPKALLQGYGKDC